MMKKSSRSLTEFNRSQLQLFRGWIVRIRNNAKFVFPEYGHRDFVIHDFSKNARKINFSILACDEPFLTSLPSDPRIVKRNFRSDMNTSSIGKNMTNHDW
eukprot:TRINITY_DN6740_c0_g1_i8.p1 TRINITY_DN6740_c0_g1~~TRINITY_DN6740_c0_g1_i8.p1  ORF type:complete len:100 (-),score=4.87 TRINITY_DN6740_c0_g1_i8:231-530(-)